VQALVAIPQKGPSRSGPDFWISSCPLYIIASKRGLQRVDRPAEIAVIKYIDLLADLIQEKPDLDWPRRLKCLREKW
jgi:hypothetical protein